VRAFISGSGAKAAAPAKRPAAAVGPPPCRRRGRSPARAGVVRREDYLGPAAASDKMPVLGKGGKKSNGSETAKVPGTRPVTARPVPSSRRCPTSSSLPLETTVQEPTPQKPDLKLPADALRGNRQEANLFRNTCANTNRIARTRSKGSHASAANGAASRPAGRDRVRRGAAAEAPPDLSKREKPKRGKAGDPAVVDPLLGDASSVN